jgi:crotonobetainyl-CoA:carnitine CoA-transferase CaiB-like acyl-CoA transferase
MDLSDIRILDVTRLLPPAFGTKLLADLGAEVIKVENPDEGDYMRRLELAGERIYLEDDDSSVFDSANRNKKSIALDLKTDEGREVFTELVKEADAVFESFRPGVAESLGIGFDQLAPLNEELVYCSLSGFGHTGPLRDRVGHDPMYQALAGLVDQTRYSETQRPVLTGLPNGDMAGGLMAAYCILAGILSQKLAPSPEPVYFDTSIFDVMFAFSEAVAPRALVHGENPRPGDTLLSGKYACNNLYETKDGEFLVLSAVEHQFWENFCRSLGRDDLIDKHLADDRDTRERLKEDLSEMFREKTAGEWIGAFDDEVPITPVMTVAEAVNHPQTRARNLVWEDETLPPRIGFPAQTSVEIQQSDSPSPGLGDHTEEILEAYGFGEMIENFRAKGVIPDEGE